MCLSDDPAEQSYHYPGMNHQTWKKLTPRLPFIGTGQTGTTRSNTTKDVATLKLDIY